MCRTFLSFVQKDPQNIIFFFSFRPISLPFYFALLTLTPLCNMQTGLFTKETTLFVIIIFLDLSAKNSTDQIIFQGYYKIHKALDVKICRAEQY